MAIVEPGAPTNAFTTRGLYTNWDRSKLLQAATCLLCAILTTIYAFPLDGSEFMGGSVTGPILAMQDWGVLLFLVASPIVVLCPKQVSGAFTLVASLLCLPLYLYFTTPGPFRWIFRGNYSVPLMANFVWGKWSVVGTLALLIAAGFGLNGLLRPTVRE